MNLSIVTGGSKGLGKSIVESLLIKGDHVACISRHTEKDTNSLRHYSFDFENTNGLIPLLDKIFQDFPLDQYDQISLINNAGIVNPIAHADKLTEPDVLKNILINLYSPIALSAVFLNKLSLYKKKKIILNISSGVARRPKACWSVYSAAKSGLESFSVAVQKEFEGDELTKVYTFDPGVMDTDMQGDIRKVSADDFPELDRFVGYKEKNELVHPKVIAEMVIKILFKNHGPDKSHFTSRDLDL